MTDPSSRLGLELKAAEDFFELAKNANSPFLQAYYRRVAERPFVRGRIEVAEKGQSNLAAALRPAISTSSQVGAMFGRLAVASPVCIRNFHFPNHPIRYRPAVDKGAVVMSDYDVTTMRIASSSVFFRRSHLRAFHWMGGLCRVPLLYGGLVVRESSRGLHCVRRFVYCLSDA